MINTYLHKSVSNLLMLAFVLLGYNAIAITATSVGSGNWSATTTWDCLCVPGAGDDVVISSNHTVSLTKNRTARNVTISSSGVLNHGTGNRSLTVTGNYVNNGRHISTTNGQLILSGAGTSISGTGLVALSSAINITTGNKTILSGTDMTFTGVGITIGANRTVTNNGTITLNFGLAGGNASSTWINAANATLKVGTSVFPVNGTFTASASGNTVEYFGSADQTIYLPSASTYYNLTISGTGIKSLAGNTVVSGNLTISSATLDVTASNFSLTIGGNFIHSAGGNFTYRQGTVTLNGGAAQSISAPSTATFYNFTNSNTSGGITSSVGINVENTFTMSGTELDLGSNTITVGTSTAAVGTLSYTSGAVLGTYKKWLTTAGNYRMPVGVSGFNRSAIVNITGVTGPGGTLCASFVSSTPGNNGLPLTDGADDIYNTYTEGYWTLTEADGLNISGYDLDLTANGFTTFTIDNATRLLVRATAGSAWTVEGTHVAPSGNVIQRNGMSTLPAQYGVGDTTNCSAPTTSAITGSTTVCTNATGEAYSVTNTPGSTYSWTIVGGTQASGGTTNAITVDWGATGMEGTVEVTEDNGCAIGAPVTLTVEIHALPTSDISGRTNVPENQTGEVYTVTERAGYSYTWSATGGTVVSQTGGTATVDWGAAGTGQVCVDASNGCGSAPQVCLDVNKYIIIESRGTGSWDSPATWDCTCVPSATDNVKVLNGHTVTLGSNSQIANLIIEGTLDASNRRITVTGDLTVNGLVLGSSAQGVILSGAGNVLDGVGSIANSGPLTLQGGTKTIYSGASLTKSVGAVEVNGGTVVTNNGSFTVGSGDITADNASSSWVNAANSTLIIGAGIFATNGSLVATASNNTVQYSGTTAQTVYDTDYYHLSATGTNNVALSSNKTVAGSIYINSTSTLTTNNFDLNVGGNWTNDGGTFTPGTGTVTFDGSTTQIIGGTANGETFNNVVVNSGSTVTAAAAITVTVNGSLTNSGTYDNDGRLVLANGITNSGTLSGDGVHELSGGNWSNTGTFTAEGSKVLFSGSTAQTISGATNFNDIEVNNAGGVTVSSGAQGIRGTLSLTNGNFATGNLVTLLSDATETGRIGTITGGSISGNVTAQRYESGPQSWRLVGAPVGSTTLADWQGEFWTSGYTGATYPSYYGFISIYTYDETQFGEYTTGWTAPSSSGDAITPGQGYMVWIGGFPVGNPYTGTIDVTGPATTGTVVVPVNYTDDPAYGDDTDGWNLVANPYASDIDLGNVGKTASITPFGYVYDPAIGDYVALDWTAGNEIASHQAFWVKCSGSGGTVTFDEVDKVDGSTAFYRSASFDNFTLNVKGNGYDLNTEVRFKDGATESFDPFYDAYKVTSMDYYAPNVSTLSSDGKSLSKNALPITNDPISIPFMVNPGNSSSANYTISLAELNGLEDVSCIFLEDIYNNVTIDLRQADYTFNLSDTVTKAQFMLHIGGRLLASHEDVTCYGASDGLAEVAASGSGPWDVVWVNNNGDTISIVEDATKDVQLQNVPAGNYTAFVNNADGTCGESSIMVTVIQPSEVQATINVGDVLCYGEQDGEVDISITGGVGNYAYYWNTGATTDIVQNVAAGNYSVTVVDDNNCKKVFSADVEEPDNMSLTTNVTSASCFDSENGSIQLSTEGGVTPYAYEWSNGAVSSNLIDLSPGDYMVTITDKNGCTTTSLQSIEAPQPLVFASAVTNASCYNQSDGQVQLTVEGGSTPYTYTWSNGQANHSLVNINSGNYVVTIADANNCTLIESIMIDEPNEIVVNNVSTIACFNEFNGQVELTVSGGVGPYVYDWETGEQNAMLQNVKAGQYTVTVSDFNNCEKVKTITIEQKDEIIADFDIVKNKIYLSDGGQLEVQNNAVGATSYWWEFGNGISSNDFEPTAFYQNEGIYNVSFTAFNDGCYTSNTKQIEVLKSPDLVGIKQSQVDDVNVYLRNTKLIIENTDNIQLIQISNLLGQQVFQSNTIDEIIMTIDMSQFENGIYLVSIQNKDNAIVTKKVKW